MSLLWFILFILLLFIEIITINLVTVWFAFGALAAMISSFFLDNYVYQVLVFICFSVIALVVTRPFLKKFKTSKVPTNIDMVIGKSGEVIKKIDGNNYGEVKVFGNIWTATSKDIIDVGSKVKVLAIEGVKLIVEKEED